MHRCCGFRFHAQALTLAASGWPPPLQVRLRMRLDAPADCARLAALPGPACSEVRLPPPPGPELRHQPSAWAAQARLVQAAQQLLGSPSFVSRSAASLTALLQCPLGAVAPGGSLHRYPALRRLSVHEGLGVGRCSLRNGSIEAPRSLQELSVTLPRAASLGHLDWPPHLQRCSLRLAGGEHGGSHSRLVPCACLACKADTAAGRGFWATCRSLHIAATGGMLVDLEACRALRACTALQIEHAGGSGRAGGGGAEPDLQRWLEALAPLFAATPLRTLELRAGTASLQLGAAAGGSKPLLLVGDGPSSWGSPCLSAAGLPPGYRQRDRVEGLEAEFLFAPSSHSDARFTLRVWRTEG